jgi:hypothetical protein
MLKKGYTLRGTIYPGAAINIIIITRPSLGSFILDEVLLINGTNL